MSLPPSLPDLDCRISDALGADRHRLRRQLRVMQDAKAAGKLWDRNLDRWLADVERSAAILRQRRLNVPRIGYDDALPVSAERERIMAAIREHTVVIVCGETGSGKSTQLPKMCLELGRGVERMIGHTQPRRIAARSVAARIAEELKSPLGGAVGFQVRFTDTTSPQTYIKLMTDGILLAETQHDRFLDKYDTILIDEAHERSLNIDFLIGYLKQLLPKRPDLKLIITSATIDAARFAEHFGSTRGPAPVVEVSGRNYPVEIRYRPLVNEDDDDDQNPLKHLLSAVDELAHEDRGDMLIFMPTEHDIHAVAKALRGHGVFPEPPGKTLVLPLYARLPLAEQQRIFQPHSHRKIVIATNVAESSLTVPGIRFVIDTGTARISRYAAKSKVQRLPIEAISQASANQRAGRCGRIGPGICVRLYDEQDYLAREPYTPPEIQRTNLASVILQTMALRLGHVEDFPFLDPPRPGAITDGYKTLFELGAIDDERHLTSLGKRLSRIPVDPRIARMIVAAHEENCLHEMLIIAAALEVQDPRDRPADKREAADQAHAQFLHPDSDFLAYLKLWDFYHHLKSTLSRGKLTKACRQNFLSPNRLREWGDLQRQLREIVEEAGMKVGHRRAFITAERDDYTKAFISAPHDDSQLVPAERDDKTDYAPIHRALLTGLLSSVANFGQSAEYNVAGGGKMTLWPGSGVYGKKPKWVMAAELVETTRRYLRTVARIDPDWIEPLAGHLVHRSHSEPHWDRKMSSTMAFERVTLFGLTVVARRRVRLTAIDPVLSREIMIRDGLVPFEFDTRGKFLEHNRALLREAEGLRAKVRRNNLLREDDVRQAFYEARVPSDVCDGVAFEKWRREIEQTQPKLLFMSLNDFLRDDAQDVRSENYPDEITVGSMHLALEYKLEPGAEDDGLTLTIPSLGVGQLDVARLGWLVPGLLAEKVAALIKLLPKELRRPFVPVPETVRQVLSELEFGQGDLPSELARVLSRISSQQITSGMFDVQKLPAHLRLNVRVLGDEGETVAAGRDLGALRAELGPAQMLVQVSGDPRFHRDGITSWDFGELPKSISVTRGGVELHAYPAIVDQDAAISLRLMDSAEAAQRATRCGVRKLAFLAMQRVLKSQVSGFSNLNQVLMWGQSLDSPDEFKQRIALRIADRAMSLYEQVPPRTDDEFQALLLAARPRIGLAAQEVAALLGPLVQNYHLAKLAIENAPASQWQHAMEDVRPQLAALTPKGFFADVPWEWLLHYPRYFKAISMRMEKLRNNLPRDLRATDEFRGLWEEYSSRAAQFQQQGAHDENLVHYRWMLEEYRVTLFAQELGTSLSVSPQRLAKQWAKVGA